MQGLFLFIRLRKISLFLLKTVDLEVVCTSYPLPCSIGLRVYTYSSLNLKEVNILLGEVKKLTPLYAVFFRKLKKIEFLVLKSNKHDNHFTHTCQLQSQYHKEFSILSKEGTITASFQLILIRKCDRITIIQHIISRI